MDLHHHLHRLIVDDGVKGRVGRRREVATPETYCRGRDFCDGGRGRLGGVHGFGNYELSVTTQSQG